MKHKVLLTIAIAMMFSIKGRTQNDEVSVYKSMFVYNFIKYMQWPGSSQSVRIGILGKDAGIKAAFEKMARAKSTPTQQITVEEISEQGIGSCNIVYITGKVEEASAVEMIGKAKDLPIVMITDTEDWTKRGAFVSFKMHENKLKFQINKQAFERTNIKVSASLLSMSI